MTVHTQAQFPHIVFLKDNHMEGQEDQNMVPTLPWGRLAEGLSPPLAMHMPGPVLSAADENINKTANCRRQMCK